MSFKPDDPEQKSIDTALLESILTELRVIAAILNEVHDLELTPEDIENDSN